MNYNSVVYPRMLINAGEALDKFGVRNLRVDFTLKNKADRHKSRERNSISHCISLTRPYTRLPLSRAVGQGQ